jgi:hypothetical protein
MTKDMLERQNKDLRTQIDNLKTKLEISEIKHEGELKKLTEEIKQKDKTITMMQTYISHLEKDMNAQKGDMLNQINAAVASAVLLATAPLQEELKKANNEILRLKAIINKDSNNSSKPPSSNGFKKIPNTREQSGRPRGAPKGHPGHRLALPDNFDELVKNGAISKRLVDHTGGADKYVSRYVIDIEMRTMVTEYRFAVDAKLPEHLYNEVTYGDGIKAVAVLLLNEGMIAEERLSGILCGLTSGIVKISPATFESFQSTFSGKLINNGVLEQIKNDLLNGAVIHTDDTPIRSTSKIEYLENGQIELRESKKTSFDVTIRNYSNERSTIYTANPQKDKEGVIRDAIITGFHGILSHDHEAKFQGIGSLHSICGGHLMRDLIGLHDLQLIKWAVDMQKFVSAMNKHKISDQKSNIAKCDPDILASFESTYDGLIARGREELAHLGEAGFGYGEFRRMLNRLTNYKDGYMLFMKNYLAPFTNNLSERDLRPEKTRQKVSGLFRSWSGIQAHVNIRSFISTAKKRKLNLFDSISKVFSNIPVFCDS